MDETASGAILVVGSANMDLITRLDHVPAPGETVLGSPIQTSPGGKGANQAAAAGRLGANVRFVGRVGRDEHGDSLRSALVDAGVDILGLAIGDDPSSVALILLTPDGENSIVVSPSSNQHVSPADIDAALDEWDDDFAAVVCQLEIPLDTVVYASQVAEERGVRFVLNAAPAQPLPADLLSRCDPLVVNESEAALLLGLEESAPADEALDLTRRLLELGPQSVVITLGSAGAVVAESADAVQHVPAHRVEAVDSTGAGDAFVAALVTRLVAGESLEEAARYAAVVGAIVVQSEGAQASYPDADRVEAVRAEFGA